MTRGLRIDNAGLIEKQSFAAKLLLAVAALRDKNPARASELHGELHRRFPDNELYTREMDRIDKGAH